MIVSSLQSQLRPTVPSTKASLWVAPYQTLDADWTLLGEWRKVHIFAAAVACPRVRQVQALDPGRVECRKFEIAISVGYTSTKECHVAAVSSEFGNYKILFVL